MANQEQLALLMQGVEAWNQWKTDTQEVRPDLKWNLCYDADLSGADLHEIDLSGVNLGLVDLSESNLANTSLVGAYLAHAELIYVNATRAHLAKAHLKRANLGGADLTNADLSGADLNGADLSDACLQGANLRYANLSHADLSNTNLQGADLSGANFSDVSYEGYFNRAKIRQIKDAGAVVHPRNADQQSIYHRRWFRLKRKNENQELILYPRVSMRLLGLIGGSLFFVIVGIWALMSSPDNLVQMVVGGIGSLFFGLGVLVFLFQLFRQLVSPLPLLVLNEEGLHYFSSPVLGLGERNGLTSLTWQEIGALGLITSARTATFAVYASAHRWRSGWSPSLQIPQSLLPISVKRLLALLQERYQAQIAAYHIEMVELADTSPTISRKRKKT